MVSDSLKNNPLKTDSLKTDTSKNNTLDISERYNNVCVIIIKKIHHTYNVGLKEDIEVFKNIFIQCGYTNVVEISTTCWSQADSSSGCQLMNTIINKNYKLLVVIHLETIYKEAEIFKSQNTVHLWVPNFEFIKQWDYENFNKLHIKYILCKTHYTKNFLKKIGYDTKLIYYT